MDRNTMLYTAITDNYDNPRTDIKCFTGYDRFKDPRLNAKIYKCLPHLFMPEESYWIWVDGNLTLKDGAVKKLVEMTGDDEVAVFENPYRDTVEEEIAEIKRLNLDKAENIDGMKLIKDRKLPACFLIIRKNTPEVRRGNERWWSLITTGSVRDQISFATAYSEIKYFSKVHPFDNQFFRRCSHIKPRINGV